MAPVQYADNSSVLAAFDLSGNAFFPVVCTYKGTQGAKIYLVNDDIETGIKMLKSPDLAYSVTNGEVKDCQLIFLGISDRPDGTWATDDTGVAIEYEQDPLILEFNSTLLDSDNGLNAKMFQEDPDMDLDFDDVWEDEFLLEFLEEELLEDEKSKQQSQ